ncbi:TPA: hypothetical protein MC483_001858 [Klebsiella variicola]|nr:hypothetical protein [Klebsiella variicola]
MTTIFKFNDSSFTHATRIKPPVRDGVVQIGLMGNMVGKSLFGDTKSEAVGTITQIAALISRLGINKYIQTNLKATSDLTFITIAKCYLPEAGNNNLLIGDNLNINSAGQAFNSTGILLTPAGVIGVVGVKNKSTGANTNYNASGTLGIPSGKENAAWKCLALRIGIDGISGGTNSVSLKNLTDNVEVVRTKMDTTLYERQSDMTKTIQVGAMVDPSTQNNDFDHFGYAICDRALTDGELYTLYAQLQGIGESNSVIF